MAEAPVRTFTQLVAWQKARVVRKAVSALVKTWPVEEKYRLTDQIIRSSRGPCSHIAEGFGRFYEKENVRFCRIAKGSLYETLDHLSAAYDEAHLTRDALKKHWDMVEEAIRVLNGYIRYLNNLGRSGELAEPAVAYGDAGAIFAEAPDDLEAAEIELPLDGEHLTTDN